MSKNVLIVGSWAKEQITIENIKRDPNVKIFCYLDTKNPGIIELTHGHKIGSLYKVNSIVEYAKEIKADMVIITTALPLSLGVVNALENDNINVFGPNKSAARMESDKTFARRLMQKYKINAIPEFEVFNKKDAAIEFAKNSNWQVAIKPTGLTEGLGVKVFGDQLKTDKEVTDYITKVLNNDDDPRSSVLIEEKLIGQEFSIQCFVNNDIVLTTPAIQDFKKLLPGDIGLNTASMGSYSNAGYRLPFMKQTDYDLAVNLIKKTVLAFQQETGDNIRGFLYGQFMLTEKGIKVIEYNFRPGDPEWLNTLTTLQDNVMNVIESLFGKSHNELNFENKATVCKYLVPKDYPMKLNQVLNVTFDKAQLQQNGVKIYYSCGMDEKGSLNVGSERGLAVVAKADTIIQASEKVEKGIKSIKGDFHYRADIGGK